LGATAKIEHVTSSWIRSLFLTILTPWHTGKMILLIGHTIIN
jgi:hypothetical protein